MKVLYPEVTGEVFEVRTYFELANIKASNGGGRVTLHDPCFYGRYLELSHVPATILENLGIECVPVRNSGKFTNCCGGPAESVSPGLAKEVLERRIGELRATGAPIVAMCPICLGNLLRAGVQAEDLSLCLWPGTPSRYTRRSGARLSLGSPAPENHPTNKEMSQWLKRKRSSTS